MPRPVDYLLIFLVTFGIAASATATAIYLIYYPIPGKEEKDSIRKQLETVNFQFILLMSYFIVFAFLGS